MQNGEETGLDSHRFVQFYIEDEGLMIGYF